MAKLDLVAEIEKRKIKDNQIFTSITNETRLESLSMIRKYKQEMKPPAGSMIVAGEGGTNGTTITVTDIRARYLQELQNGNEMFKEIENILNKALPKYDINPKQQLKQSQSAPHGIQQNPSKLKSLKKNTSTTTFTRHRKSKSTNLKLAPLEERYGNITENWQRGPIDIPKDQYYDLNDESIFGNSHDPRARQLKQQTRCLMNSLTTMSKQARVNATCRRRVVENSQEMGEDHVVESLDRFLPGDLSHPGQGRAILESALEKITYRQRKPRRRVNGRIDEIWEILSAPPGSKLGFKLHSETVSPHILSDRLATQREAIGHEGSSLTSSVSMILLLEKLVDCIHIIDLLHLLLKKWVEDDSLPRIFSSNDLIQPLSTLLRGVGITKGSKKTGDDICEWFVSMLQKLDHLSTQLIADVRILAADLEDSNFELFLSNLEKIIRNMVSTGISTSPPKPAVSDEQPVANMEANEMYEGLDDYWKRRDGDLEVRQFHSADLKEGIVGGEILTVESTLSSHPIQRQKKGGRISSDPLADDENSIHSSDPSPVLKADASPPPLKPLNSKNHRSLKIRQSLVPITEVVNISELERYHHQKPNYELLSRVTKRLEESIKERSDQM